jgi:hypothetical protein
MVAVPLLIRLLRDRVCDPAAPQVSAESARAASLVRDHTAGSVAWPATAGARNANPFQQRPCAGAVVTPARCHEDGEGAALAVAGEVGFGGQPSTGSAEEVIVRFGLHQEEQGGRSTDRSQEGSEGRARSGPLVCMRVRRG